ncbi:glycoside hydrolase family 140 protein [Algoriphagus sp.]|uniref:glycoside hydrolase family 140 protein n=1 Tax=Algoriphagus sp. TaxID=1872435 RepID=UPI0032791E60
MKISFSFWIFQLCLIQTLFAQQITGPIRIHPNQRYFMDAEGQPFFWTADTAWELFHRLNQEETKMYFTKRADQGFNVIQAVVLAEENGLNDPNTNGDKPFLDEQYTQPNEAYFRHVDQVMDMALERGLHIALLPTWGDKVALDNWGQGPVIFDEASAYAYGKWIGNRYRNQKNLIWVLGGDRNPRKNSNDRAIWNEMARGIMEQQNPENRQLMTFHPQPTAPGGSSNWFHSEDWLDFNMHQTGHCPNQATYQKIHHDLALNPAKPTIDAEPMYEEHPKCFDAKNQGYSEATDIRKIMYWNVFAGAAGQTYGCHAVWQMFDLDKKPVNAPLKPWHQSLDLEAANQMKHLKKLMISRPYFERIPDQSMIVEQQLDDETYVSATRDKKGSYGFFYFPDGKSISINLENLTGTAFKVTWFDPRTGVEFPGNGGSPLSKETSLPIRTPSSGRGNDWVLIVDSID